MVSCEKFWLLATLLNILFEFSLPATGAGNYYLVKWFKNSFDLLFFFFLVVKFLKCFLNKETSVNKETIHLIK